MNQPNKTLTLYRCPKNIVTVVRSLHLKRNPQHKYPGVLFIMRVGRGTRVQTTPDGRIEFMANYDEVKAFLIGIEPKFAKILPAFMQNKPIERQRFYDQKNAKRLAAK